jgi:hypothetical protein
MRRWLRPLPFLAPQEPVKIYPLHDLVIDPHCARPGEAFVMSIHKRGG